MAETDFKKQTRKVEINKLDSTRGRLSRSTNLAVQVLPLLAVAVAGSESGSGLNVSVVEITRGDLFSLRPTRAENVALDEASSGLEKKFSLYGVLITLFLPTLLTSWLAPTLIH